MRKNSFRNRIAALPVIVLTVAALCMGCGRSSGVSDKQLRLDIAENLDDISEYDLTIDSVKIKKRQTSREDRTDYIWADVSAHNDNCTYTVYCEIYYGLYNDGWHFDWIYAEDVEILPKEPAEEFDQEIVDNVVKEMGYSDFWLEDRTERSNIIYFEYGAYDEDGVEMTISIEYDFSPLTGWTLFTSAAIEAGAYDW